MPCGNRKLRRFIALEWPKLLLSTMQSALAPQHLKDVLFNLDWSDGDDDALEVLKVHFDYSESSTSLNLPYCTRVTLGGFFFCWTARTLRRGHCARWKMSFASSSSLSRGWMVQATCAP